MKNILLLHGAIGAKDQLDPLKEQLAVDNNVYSFNFSGHGGEAFKSAFNIQQFAEDALDFINQNKLEQVNIFGYSMGGYVALYLAKYYPEKVAKIITLGTKFKWTEDIAAREVKMLNPAIIEEKIPAFAAALEKRHSSDNWKQVLNKTAEMMLAMGNENPLLLNDFKHINHSCKIMLADDDEMVTEAETIDVANALPNADYKTLNNSRHPIEKVNLDQLVKEIEQCLESKFINASP